MKNKLSRFIKLKEVIFPFSIIFLILITYWNLTKSFFEQDEWLGIGGILYYTEPGRPFLEVLYKYIRDIISERMVPLTVVSLYFQFKTFSLQFSYYALVSIALHLINSFLIFYLSLTLLKNKYLAFISALFFGLNSIASQTVTWIAATMSTQTAASFFLLSLLFLSKFILGKKKKTFFLGLSFLFLFIGILFKEIILPLFIVIPLFWLIYSPKVNKEFLKKIVVPLFIIALFYFFIKYAFVPQNLNGSPQLKPWLEPHATTYVYRLVTAPFKIISQSVAPAELMISISKKIIFLGYPQYFVYSETEVNPYVSETVIFDSVSYMLSFLIFFLLYVSYRFSLKSKNNEFLKPLLVSIMIIIVSSLPFVFIPGIGGYFSIYEPRHLYIPLIGSSLMLTILIYSIAKIILRKQKLATIFSIAILLPFIWFSVLSIKGRIHALVENAKVRKMILNTISDQHKTLPNNAVIYTESDSPYYGLPLGQNILPFQSGFGQTLLVWYYSKGEKLPSCFFDHAWLYYLDKDQGYKNCNGRGFGYFRDFESLKRAIQENNLSHEEIIAFSWNSKKKIFRENTQEIKNRLKQSSINK